MTDPAQAPTARRVVYYTRVPQGGESEQQLAWRAARARSRIATCPAWTLANIITDAGSGLRLNPGLRRLLDHARDHQFDLVLVDRLSDLSRSPMVLDSVLTILDECAVVLHTLDGSVRIAPPTRRLVARLWALLSDYEQITHRARRVRQRRAITQNRERA